jgi:hypothetical protein
MPAENGSPVRRLTRGLLIAAVLAWCVCVGWLLATTPYAQARPASLPVWRSGVAADPATPANTPAATATTAPTSTPVPIPQAPSGPVGPEPTRVSLGVPAVATAANGPTTGFAPAGLTSNGLLIATTLGCIVGILGLMAVLVTWFVLSSNGWGPLLKSVLLGNRKGRRRFHRLGEPEPRMPSSHGSRGDWR